MKKLENQIRNFNSNVPHDLLQNAVDSISVRFRKLADVAGTKDEF